jgi:hypothetical protein
MSNEANLDPRTLRAKQEYEGKEFYCSDGIHKFVVEKFNSASDIIILFPGTDLRMKKQMNQIKKGQVTYPFKHTVYFEDPVIGLMNSYYQTNQGYYIKIIGVESMAKVTYQFQDSFGYIGTTTIQNIEKGQVRNPYHMNEFGGYLGEGPYTGDQKLYNTWHCMMVRGTGCRQKYDYYGPAQQYKTCKMCNEWRNYNVFAHWYVTNISKLNPNYVYEVDKDLLYPLYRTSTEGYKLYCPLTCVLIPHELNLLFQGMEKAENISQRINMTSPEKLNHIIQLTEQLWSEGAISEKTYKAIRFLYYRDGTVMNYINFRGGINYYENAYRLKD